MGDSRGGGVIEKKIRDRETLRYLLAEQYGDVKDHDAIKAKWDDIEKILNKYDLNAKLIAEANLRDDHPSELTYKVWKAFGEIVKKFPEEAYEIFSKRYSIRNLDVINPKDYELLESRGRNAIWEGVDTEGRHTYIVSLGFGKRFPKPESIGTFTQHMMKRGGRIDWVQRSAWMFKVNQPDYGYDERVRAAAYNLFENYQN